jgi:hypothetical protein
MPNQQTTNHILMVRPAHFGYNEQTAESNAFQTRDAKKTAAEIEAAARAEFDEFVRRLREAGVTVHVAEDSVEPVKTDAVFPNNWVTFHADGTVVTYPMLSENRRQERDEKILEQLESFFVVNQRLHLETYELEQLFLEGTGSMILDREHRIAYACVSPRTDPQLLDLFCQKMGYTSLLFRAVDQDGVDIYHTNVMMALGETFVVICMESIPDAGEREQLLGSFAETGKEVIDLSFDQMMSFAGNMLQVRNNRGEGVLVMSEQAYRSLRPEQVSRLEKHTLILHSPIDIIETYGGGSARCMMAEIFLPENGPKK